MRGSPMRRDPVGGVVGDRVADHHRLPARVGLREQRRERALAEHLRVVVGRDANRDERLRVGPRLLVCRIGRSSASRPGQSSDASYARAARPWTSSRRAASSRRRPGAARRSSALRAARAAPVPLHAVTRPALVLEQRSLILEDRVRAGVPAPGPAGVPWQIVHGGRSRVTSELEPTIAPSPMVTPGCTTTFVPEHGVPLHVDLAALDRTPPVGDRGSGEPGAVEQVRAADESRTAGDPDEVTRARCFPPPVRLAKLAMCTCEPIETPPPPSMNTKSSTITWDPTEMRLGSRIRTQLVDRHVVPACARTRSARCGPRSSGNRGSPDPARRREIEHARRRSRSIASSDRSLAMGSDSIRFASESVTARDPPWAPASRRSSGGAAGRSTSAPRPPPRRVRRARRLATRSARERAPARTARCRAPQPSWNSYPCGRQRAADAAPRASRRAASTASRQSSAASAVAACHSSSFALSPGWPRRPGSARSRSSPGAAPSAASSASAWRARPPSPIANGLVAWNEKTSASPCAAERHTALVAGAEAGGGVDHQGNAGVGGQAAQALRDLERGRASEGRARQHRCHALAPGVERLLQCARATGARWRGPRPRTPA